MSKTVVVGSKGRFRRPDAGVFQCAPVRLRREGREEREGKGEGKGGEGEKKMRKEEGEGGKK